MELDINSLISLAPQLAITFVFIWFSERKDKKFSEMLDRKDSLHKEERHEFLEALNKNTEMVEEVLREVRGGKR